MSPAVTDRHVGEAGGRAGRAERRVLIADDDPTSLRYVGNLLLEHGYSVYAAGTGRLAIEIAERVRPDLILLDIRMPEPDGIATCYELKRRPRTASTPVIFLTGRDDEPSILRAFDAGGADYVVKPFQPSVLVARVRTHLELGVLSQGLDQALSERTRELEAANIELRRLGVHLSLLEQAEKTRLATELHDSPMQKLALAQMQLDGATEHPGPESAQQIVTGLALLREAIGELRTLQFDLSPPVLEQKGLDAALAWLADTTETRSRVQMTCTLSGRLPPLLREQSVILFQCVRELVHNLIKHSGARHGAIQLDAQGDRIELIIEDDGVGLDPTRLGRPESSRGGFGLYSVRERLAVLGGELRIESIKPGTRIRVTLPLAPTRAAQQELEPRDG